MQLYLTVYQAKLSVQTVKTMIVRLVVRMRGWLVGLVQLVQDCEQDYGEACSYASRYHQQDGRMGCLEINQKVKVNLYNLFTSEIKMFKPKFVLKSFLLTSMVVGLGSKGLASILWLLFPCSEFFK